MDSQQPPAKRRKKNKRDPNTLYFADGKSFKLPDGYLTGLPKKEDVPKNDVKVVEKEAKQKDVKEETDIKEELKFKKIDGKKRVNKGPQTEKIQEDSTLLKSRQKLPIWNLRDKIQETMRSPDHDVLVLVGETGSGKSTQVPQFLYQESWCRQQTVKFDSENINVGGMIAITQPRRVAATTLAHRVAQETGCPLRQGRKDGAVGYSVRFDYNVPRGAKIKFMTEGMMLQELLRDPNLRQYSAIVVDEIHERSLDVDLLVGFLKQILAGNKAGRGGVPLKVIIMSATADVDKYQGFFEDIYPEEKKDAVQVMKIKGRQFPVEDIYTPKPVTHIDQAFVQTIFKIHKEEPLPGDILCFLIGQEEIESTQKLIEEYAESLDPKTPKIKVFPLYGQLSMEAQREAFLPVKGLTRKVVLATNIAETSVTVPGVRFVVDCGKAKVKQFRSRLNMESLLAMPISKSSAIQRSGRAGREAPGKCYRLYTKETYSGLKDADLPEILRVDVLGAALTMKARGVEDVFSFPLMDSPDGETFHKAMCHLHTLQAVGEDQKITSNGLKMARFPLPATLGAVLLAAASPDFDCLLDVIDIISCITSGEDIFLHLRSEEQQEEFAAVRKELYRREGDLITYLTTMQQYTAENSDRLQWCKNRRINIRNMKQALNIRRQLRSVCKKEGLLTDFPPADPQPFIPASPERASAILKCFLRGFVMKSAMLCPDGSYETWSGRHTVTIHPASVLHAQKKEAICFLDYVYTSKSYAKKVSAIQADWILEAYMASASEGMRVDLGA